MGSGIKEKIFVKVPLNASYGGFNREETIENYLEQSQRDGKQVRVVYSISNDPGVVTYTGVVSGLNLKKDYFLDSSEEVKDSKIYFKDITGLFVEDIKDFD